MCLPRDLTSTEAEYYMSRADAAWRVETKPFTPQKYEIIRTKELTKQVVNFVKPDCTFFKAVLKL